MSFLGYMTANFASDEWRKSVSDLDFGNVFSPLAPYLLWVLETTVADDEKRTEDAFELAAGLKWFGFAYASTMIEGTHVSKLITPKFVSIGDNITMLLLAGKSYSKQDQESLKSAVGDAVWPCAKYTQQRIAELLEVAVFRFYAVIAKPDELMTLDIGLGHIYMFPNERMASVERAMALQPS